MHVKQVSPMPTLDCGVRAATSSAGSKEPIGWEVLAGVGVDGVGGNLALFLTCFRFSLLYVSLSVAFFFFHFLFHCFLRLPSLRSRLHQPPSKLLSGRHEWRHLSIKAPKECSKKFAAAFKEKFLTRGDGS